MEHWQNDKDMGKSASLAKNLFMLFKIHVTTLIYFYKLLSVY